MTATEGSTSLGELTARATALKTRSETLKAQETALRHRYCE
jgi:chaperonin cofactor prefoldin